MTIKNTSTIVWASLVGDNGPIWNLLKEGHTVYCWWGKKETPDGIGLKKLFPKTFHPVNGPISSKLEVTKFQEALGIADFLVIDDLPTKALTLVKQMTREAKKASTPVIGGNSKYAFYEFDRQRTRKILEGLGCDKMPFVSVITSLKTLQAYLRKVKTWQGRFVVKAVDGGRKAGISSLILGSREELKVFGEIDPFKFLKQEHGFHVEPFIEGVEMDFAFYSNGTEFSPILVNQEHKPPLDMPDFNILSGEIGTIFQWAKMKTLKPRVSKLLERIKETLLKDGEVLGGYVGYWDVGLMWEPRADKLYVIEVTPRLGCPTETGVSISLGKRYITLLRWMAGLGALPKVDFNNVLVNGALYNYGTPWINGVGSGLPVMGLEKIANWVLTGGIVAKAKTGYKVYTGFLGTGPLSVYGKDRSITRARTQYRKSIAKLSGFNLIHYSELGDRWIAPSTFGSNK